MKHGDSLLTAISSRHYVPSQAKWRRTAVKLDGLSGWFWISPIERWEDIPGHDREIVDGEHKVTGSATVLFDPKIGGDGTH